MRFVWSLLKHPNKAACDMVPSYGVGVWTRLFNLPKPLC
ncbi:hypothetical protein CES85_1774 [Ochrobactrum quorumnocens]|uniref:Uncharacterized protein n=1 Tax=Ochrobactrum quorumnocens TaxID=271865 RepID=A0A248UEK8_9HYPH|nr:hypothetical protein CES85_1774 [[Ochrobactrum] quorumnocens]